MKRKAWRTAPIAAGALAAILFSRVPPVSAQSTEKPADQPGDQAATETGAPSHPGGLWQREMLTGDWGGLRTALEQKGLSLGANEIGEVLGNITGGIKRGTVFEGRLEMLVDLDLDKAVGWSGATFHANAYQIHGRGLSANDLGNNILIASGIEATRATRLFDLWLQQELFDGLLSIRIGQIAADDEFFVSQYAANFINSTFGWPDILATVLPSAGPAYPLATPGARVKLAPTERLSFAVAIFNGDPAGPGIGDPQLRDPSGTSFRLSDGAFFIGEAAYALNHEKDAGGLPGTYKLGGWYHTGRFADQHFDGSGRSLADPASSGVAALHRGDFGFYAIADQLAWREPGTTDNGLGIFLRLAGNPSDRNLVDAYVDGGISYKGLFPDRGDDVFGIAVGFARISEAASARDRDARRFTGTSSPVRNFETALEIMYRAQLAPWWTLQPDLQYIFHPGGNIADPSDPRGIHPIGDALILGARSAITF